MKNQTHDQMLRFVFLLISCLGCVNATVECTFPFECSNTTTITSGIGVIYCTGYKSNFGNGAIIVSSYRNQIRGAFAAQHASSITSEDQTKCFGESSVCQWAINLLCFLSVMNVCSQIIISDHSVICFYCVYHCSNTHIFTIYTVFFCPVSDFRSRSTMLWHIIMCTLNYNINKWCNWLLCTCELYENNNTIIFKYRSWWCIRIDKRYIILFCFTSCILFLDLDIFHFVSILYSIFIFLSFAMFCSYLLCLYVVIVNVVNFIWNICFDFFSHIRIYQW